MSGVDLIKESKVRDMLNQMISWPVRCSDKAKQPGMTELSLSPIYVYVFGCVAVVLWVNKSFALDPSYFLPRVGLSMTRAETEHKLFNFGLKFRRVYQNLFNFVFKLNGSKSNSIPYVPGMGSGWTRACPILKRS